MIAKFARITFLFVICLIHQTNFMMDRFMNVMSYCVHDSLVKHDSLHDYSVRIRYNFAEPDVRNFLTEFSPPRDLLSDLMQKKDINIYDPASLDHEYYKGKARYVLSRVLCGKRLQNIIAENDYKRIAVPNKYLFLTNADQSFFHKKLLLCYSEKVIPTEDKAIMVDSQQMKELADVVLKTRFCDAHTWNFIVDQQKRIVFIDTDLESFSHGPRYESHNLKKLWTFLNLGKNNDIFTPEENEEMGDPENYSCKMHKVYVKVSDDAKDYLSDLISIHDTSLNSTYRSFTQKSEYDSKDLKVSHIFPLINTWIYNQNNSCKRDSESRWYYRKDIFQ